MTYDPNVDHTVERMKDTLKSQLRDKREQWAQLKVEIETLSSTLSTLDTISSDEQRRLERLKKEAK